MGFYVLLRTGTKHGLPHVFDTGIEYSINPVQPWSSIISQRNRANQNNAMRRLQRYSCYTC